MSRRALVAKTYKLYLGGAFVRSESGRSDPATDHAGAHLANVPRASRKDVRDAVKAARGALGGWAKRTAYNRGQVLYRFAEALESRSDELARAAVAQRDVSLAEAPRRARRGRRPARPLRGLDGQARRRDGRRSTRSPAPHLSFSTPEPTGVVAVLAPDEPDVLGLIREIAPALAAGNTVVAIVSRRWPLRALDLGEVAGVSDVPGGVLNLLCGPHGRAADAAVRPSRRQRDRRRHRRRRAWPPRSTSSPPRPSSASPARRRTPTRCRGSRRSWSSRPPGTRSGPSGGVRCSRCPTRTIRSSRPATISSRPGRSSGMSACALAAAWLTAG